MDRTVDTVRTSIVKETAQFLVRMVDQHQIPQEYDRVHHENGKRYRVTVGAYDGDEIDRRLEQYVKESDYLAPKADK